MYKIIGLILTIGVNSTDEFHVRRGVYKSNFITLLLQILIFFSSILYFILGLSDELIQISFFGIGINVIYLLNKIGWHEITKFILAIICNIACFLLAGRFGDNAVLQYLVLSVFCFPFVLFEIEKLFFVGLGIFSLLIILSFQYNLIGKNVFIDISGIQHVSFLPILLFIFVMLLTNMYFLAKDNELHARILKDAKEKFEQQVTEAKNVILSSNYKNQNNSIAEVLAFQYEELKEGEKKMKKMNSYLTRLNNDLDNFIYIASHDLKTPMSNIEGLIFALKGISAYESNKEFKELIERMVLCSEGFKNTISKLTERNNILFSEEIEEMVSFEDVLFETLNEIEIIISSTGSIIKCNFSRCPTVKINKKNLQRIFFNLITNSLKFRSNSKKNVISITSDIISDGAILLTVKDNGTGIAPKTKNLIEKMLSGTCDFNEVISSGLCILKKVIIDKGGKVEIETCQSIGTEIKIYFKNNS